MPLITGPVDNVDRAVEHVARDYMEAMASPIQTVTASLALLMIIILTINYFLQFKQINYREYLPILVKVVIVQAIISSWANYSSIYEVLTVFPDRLAGGLLNAVGIGNGTIGSIYGIIQGIIGGFIGVGVGFVFATTIFSVGMFVIAQMAFGVAITSLSAVLAVVLGAKIALTLAIAIGPLFIPFVIHKSSTPFFQNWLRFTVGAAITPVIFCGMLAVIASAIRAGGGGLSGIIGSLVLIACSAVLIKQIPQIVGALMGSFTPTAATPTASEIGQAVAKADGKFKNARNADAAIKTAQQHLDGVSAETGQEAKLSKTERMQIAAASYRMSNHQQEQMRDSSRIDRMDGALGRAADRAYDAHEAGERPWEQVPTTPTESGDASSAIGSGDNAKSAPPPPAASTAAASTAAANEAQSNDDDDADKKEKKKRSRKPTPRPKPTDFREKYYGSRGASSTDDRIARANNRPKSG